MTDFYHEIFGLHGRRAVVTGAASGLGKVVAEGMLAAGADVMALDVNAQGLAGIAGPKGPPRVRQADVTNKDDVVAAFEAAKQQLGGLDILINCAGITRRMPGEDFVEADWDNVLDVNLKGTFLCCQAAGRLMLAQGKGSIVNFASLGSMVGIRSSVAYCSSKGGVMQLTKTLALEWAPRGVRVNAVVPGVFETPLLAQCIQREPDYGLRMLAKIPMGRFGKPAEILPPVVFLASDASSHVTGHLLVVDGGYLAE